jgi:hypothetical protein
VAHPRASWLGCSFAAVCGFDRGQLAWSEMAAMPLMAAGGRTWQRSVGGGRGRFGIGLLVDNGGGLGA